MPRTPKWRHVENVPRHNYFKPAGVPLRELEEVILNVEELEALRLKDVEGLEQEACAERMKVSRPTFQRILTLARTKVAEALTEAKAIRIEGGRFKVSKRHFKCSACSYNWELPFGTGKRGQELNCPKCESKRVYREKIREDQ
ncbi:MAG: DUF134 domain-containing protein [Candidatus Syntrophonatronum acetioxidans]|uniref:UPF0251 protein D5R97_07885 n=1 Tax=Candidatus Syntrophonatronum acetioxidans TaxID=1795816 RepID=A0A424YBM4_9FIRM|nr:MAG: DUF134 domain-containing protein [Candidatus Syntrophonatronum acetioxidans]